MYSPGAVDKAIYTKSVCDLKKQLPTEPADAWYVDIAYPDQESRDYVTKGLTDYFQGQFSREHIHKSASTVVTPANLTRFFQVYQITQDTQFKHPQKRPMNIEIEVVMLSTIFVIVGGLATLMCLFGVLRYGIFTIQHYKAVDRTPQSKLDWMIQSIEKLQPGASPLLPHSQYGTPNPNGNNPYGYANQGPQQRRARHSVTSMRSPDVASPTVGRRKSDFETATYGSSPEPSTPYHMNWLSSSRRQSSGGGYFPLQEEPDEAASELSVNLGRYPTAPAGPLGSSGGVNGMGISGAQGWGNDYQIQR
jgi:hypothetical protein